MTDTERLSATAGLLVVHCLCIHCAMITQCAMITVTVTTVTVTIIRTPHNCKLKFNNVTIVLNLQTVHSSTSAAWHSTV